MKARVYSIFFILGLIEVLVAAAFVSVPGYMDAEYYYSGGVQLATGNGFMDPFLWNYLDDPQELPHASHTYWMPLASLIAAGGIFLTGEPDFTSGRLIFFILAACIPSLTAWLAWRLSQDRFKSILAGSFALVPGYYLVYLGQTDSFATSMIMGTFFLVLASQSSSSGWLRWSGLGLTAGLMHLSRADGIVWYGIGLGLAGWTFTGQTSAKSWNWRKALGRVLSLSAGYFVVMLPWYIRNIQLFRSPFSAAGSRMLWLTEYDALFSYPASQINSQEFFAQGIGVILKTRLDALLANLSTALGVQGEIFILVLAMLGMWKLRRTAIVRLGTAVWCLTLIVMTLVFPMAGARGGFFHAGAAFQPLIWALAPVGFISLVEIGVHLRNWKLERARVGFGLILISIAAVLTVVLFWTQVVGLQPSNGYTWDASWRTYIQVDRALDKLNIPGDAVFMVNNPPGFYLATGRPAVVIPFPGYAALIEVAHKYGANYVILEKNGIKELQDLYVHPQNYNKLAFLMTVGDAQVYKIND